MTVSALRPCCWASLPLTPAAGLPVPHPCCWPPCPSPLLLVSLPLTPAAGLSVPHPCCWPPCPSPLLLGLPVPHPCCWSLCPSPLLLVSLSLTPAAGLSVPHPCCWSLCPSPLLLVSLSLTPAAGLPAPHPCCWSPCPSPLLLVSLSLTPAAGLPVPHPCCWSLCPSPLLLVSLPLTHAAGPPCPSPLLLVSLPLTHAAGPPCPCPMPRLLSMVLGKKQDQKAPDKDAILRATANLPSHNMDRAVVQTNMRDFQTELRKILVSLIDVAQKLLALNPDAVELFKKANAMLDEDEDERVDEAALRQLTEMGFPETRATKALQLNQCVGVTPALAGDTWGLVGLPLRVTSSHPKLYMAESFPICMGF
ncbi:hypothetical protein P7K49_002006 [Saguinus oedipus]|uniref:UBA domain-containing protein n=1 Tax=Saguinus oedipus TaxID=9490 RepID=A0ABQ9WG48_SAGOE|nr:hypothetical protein P7K49_002006 [Saguinus oedipus]